MPALKDLESDIIKSVGRFSRSVTGGWRELVRLSSSALTHFDVSAKDKKEAEVEQDFPRWSVLAAETWETAQSIIVRVEIPGMKAGEIKVSVQRNLLHIRGEKRSGGAGELRRYGLTERAFGRFERTISIAQRVDQEPAEVSYRAGVLTVILRKTASHR